MRRLLAVLAAVVLLLLLLLGYLRAQPPAPVPGAASALKFGPQRYTLHYRGRMVDGLYKLDQLTGFEFLAGRGYWNGPATDPETPAMRRIGLTPVVLDFDHATLDDILLGICRRYGLAAELWGSRGIVLYRGDISKDARPSADVGDYIVRVTCVRVEPQDSVRFRWGRAEPQVQHGKRLRVALLVCGKSEAACMKLMALNAGAKATTDSGEVLQSRPENGAWETVGHPFWEEVFQWETSLRFPRPTKRANKLARLEGRLMLYSSLTTVDLDLRPGDKGVPVKEGPVTATLRKWERDEKQHKLTVQVSVDEPGPEAWGPGQAPSGSVGPEPQVTLVGEDGNASDIFSATTHTDKDPARRGRLLFEGSFVPKWATDRRPGGEPDHLHLRFVRVGKADTVMPFAIENIALP